MLAQENRGMANQIPEIDVHELDKRLRKGDGRLILLDVRETSEWEFCHIRGAQHIPMKQVTHRLDELPQNARIAVLCHHGVRSAMVTDLLVRKGYDAANVRGGIDRWSMQVDPDVPRY
jgi:rhodanese-related sulfurtransferase